MFSDYLLLALIGFAAQLVDGAIGMAFGLISTSAILAMGMAPAQASALVHTAEIFTTAGSAASHIYHRNVDWRLVLRLGVSGVVGAVLGAWVLSNIDGKTIRPFISVYLLAVGVLVLMKATRPIPRSDAPVSAAAATTFFVALGSVPLFDLAALVFGGVFAAPLGGWIVKHIRPRVLMCVVGLLVIALSGWQLARTFALV